MITRNRILMAEILLTSVPLSYHVHTKTGNLLTASLTFILTSFLIIKFLNSPVKTWESMSLFLNPFIISAGTFVSSLIYLNYTGTALAAAKWQALGLSFITMVLGFMFMRAWP